MSFLEACSQNVWQQAITCCSCYRMHAPKCIFDQPKNDAKTLFFHSPSPLPGNFATATVLAFVLLRSSRFNFHCYTQREATSTQKLAWKWCCDFSRLLAQKITKGIHSCKPASLNCPIGEVILRYGGGDVGSVICVAAMYAGELGTQGSRGLGSELNPGQSVTPNPLPVLTSLFVFLYEQ